MKILFIFAIIILIAGLAVVCLSNLQSQDQRFVTNKWDTDITLVAFHGNGSVNSLTHIWTIAMAPNETQAVVLTIRNDIDRPITVSPSIVSRPLGEPKLSLNFDQNSYVIEQGDTTDITLIAKAPSDAPTGLTTYHVQINVNRT